MRALKAKRRFLRWARYQHRCWALAGHPEPGGAILYGPGMTHKMLPGYALASWDWSTAGRYAPVGIREVFDPITGMRY